MTEILQIIQSWQYPASFVFIGAFLGSFLFRIAPPPKDVAYHYSRMRRANLAGTLAGLTGHHLEKRVANVFGANEAVAIYASLKRQRRGLLIFGIIIAAIGMVFAFIYLPMHLIPNWVFGICAAVGIYQAWRAW